MLLLSVIISLCIRKGMIVSDQTNTPRALPEYPAQKMKSLTSENVNYALQNGSIALNSAPPPPPWRVGFT